MDERTSDTSSSDEGAHTLAGRGAIFGDVLEHLSARERHMVFCDGMPERAGAVDHEPLLRSARGRIQARFARAGVTR